TAGEVTPAKLSGYELTIRPRVNLAPSDRSCVYGSVVTMTHADLTTIYSHLEEHLGLKYLPQAVLSETLDSRFMPALCYIAPHMTTGSADPAYVKQLAECVRAMRLPEWYASYIESFGTEQTEKPEVE